MRFKKTKAWFPLAAFVMRLAKEGDPSSQLTASAVLGILISLQRRALHLSHQALAMNAAIDLDQLLRIESDPTYRAETTAIRRLAEVLPLPACTTSGSLGPSQNTQRKIQKAAVQFAARGFAKKN